MTKTRNSISKDVWSCVYTCLVHNYWYFRLRWIANLLGVCRNLRSTMLESTTYKHEYHVLNESSTPPALRHWCYFGLIHLNDWDMNLDLLPKNRQFTQIFIIGMDLIYDDGGTSFKRLSDIDMDERDVDSFLEDLADIYSDCSCRIMGEYDWNPADWNMNNCMVIMDSQVIIYPEIMC